MTEGKRERKRERGRMGKRERKTERNKKRGREERQKRRRRRPRPRCPAAPRFFFSSKLFPVTSDRFDPDLVSLKKRLRSRIRSTPGVGPIK